MTSIQTASRSLLPLLLATSAFICGCESQKKHDWSSSDKKNGAAVYVHVRQDAEWPVTRYSYNGEICDIAIGPACHNADNTKITFGWHAENQQGALYRLDAGMVVVQGTFPPVLPVANFPVPWPIIVTNWISIGSEGTTFAVYKGTDASSQLCNYVFLYDGGPLKVEVLGASPPSTGTTFPPGDTKHRRIVAQSGKVLFVKASMPTAGVVVISEPIDVKLGDYSVSRAFACIEDLRAKSQLDKPFPALTRAP